MIELERNEMRYTGYKDKNGENIYEGYTVRFKTQNHYFTRVVEFYGGGWTPFFCRDERADIGGIESKKCEIIDRRTIQPTQERHRTNNAK